MQYHPRIIEAKLEEYLRFFPVVGLTGPRQSGKSTLLLHLLKDYRYVTFDDYRVVESFYTDPQKFIRIYSNKVIFDEVQKAPELFNYIKIEVDRDRNNYGKFILTGSSQFTLVSKISESLAGRIGLLSLLPYQLSELPKKCWPDSVFKGGYPELANRSYQLFSDWFDAYLATYVNKDVSAIAHIGDIRDFQRLIRLLAANTAQILNMSRFANDIGVDIKTIKRWLGILEASYIIFLLPSYYRNLGKRIVKSPKIYFYDVGLVSFLTGIQNHEHFINGPMSGAIFENYIISEIVKKELHYKTHAELFYYRTSHGEEIDLIVDRKNYKELIEIKITETFRPKMTATIEKFLEPGDKGYLLYNGEKVPFVSNIEVINYKTYLLK